MNENRQVFTAHTNQSIVRFSLNLGNCISIKPGGKTLISDEGYREVILIFPLQISDLDSFIKCIYQDKNRNKKNTGGLLAAACFK